MSLNAVSCQLKSPAGETETGEVLEDMYERWSIPYTFPDEGPWICPYGKRTIVFTIFTCFTKRNHNTFVSVNRPNGAHVGDVTVPHF